MNGGAGWPVIALAASAAGDIVGCRDGILSNPASVLRDVQLAVFGGDSVDVAE